MPTATTSFLQTKPPGAGPALVKLAVVTGAFCLAVCAAMIYFELRAKANDPLKSPQLAALKEKLLAAPKDEQLKQQIRSLDLEFRRRYFRQLLLNGSGAWLVFGAASVFLLASKRVLHTRQPLPMPRPNTSAAEQHARTTTWSRWAVGASGGLVAVGLLSFALNSRTPLPQTAADLAKLLEPARSGAPKDFASVEEMERNWPRFRGASGNGVCTQTNLPLTWNAATGEGIAWKAEVPVPGFNSPIVWGGRVFLSGGDAAKRELVCFGTQTGDLLWRSPLPVLSVSQAKPLEIPEQTGFAASTTATDGKRIYAIFATGELAAFTLEGKQVWAKSLGVPKNPHGHASSLLTWENRLIVQLDQGEAEKSVSKLYAFDGASGQLLWQQNRSVPASWATPIVVQASGKPQIITLAVPWVMAYAAKDGSELWRVEGLNNEVTPSAVFAAGLVFAVSPNEKLMAIRPDGQGDVTKTHIAWAAEDDVPDISSPVSNGELIFTVSTPGVVTCYDVKDGKKQWQQDLGMECNASPSIAGNRLYLVGNKGIVVVAEVARAFKELARSDLGEKVFASPAFTSGKIFIRGEKHLFCIGPDPKLARSN